MPAESSASRPSEEQSIKSRKAQLFEAAQEPAGSTGPRKSFPEYLRETPPAPLSAGTKALLWLVGAIVVLVFLAALMRGARRPAPAPAAEPAAESEATGLVSPARAPAIG